MSQMCLNPLQSMVHRPIHCSPESQPAQLFQHELKTYLAAIKHDDNRNDSMLEGFCLEQLSKACGEGKPGGKMGEQPTKGTHPVLLAKLVK